jgi:hypothetical protein
MKQLQFPFARKLKNTFGGSLLEKKRKSARPISTKKPIHLILKSDEKNLFLPGNRSLEILIRDQCKNFNIKLYEHALNWSHIHFNAVRLRDTPSWD